MLAPQDAFLPQTLNQWLTALGFVSAWTFAAWRAYSKLANDSDKIGEKVNGLVISCSNNNTELTNIKVEQQRATDERGNMRERLATSEKGLETLASELSEERLAVMSMLHANEKAAGERDAQTREQLATIKERLNIEVMVRSVVRNMRDSSAQG